MEVDQIVLKLMKDRLSEITQGIVLGRHTTLEDYREAVGQVKAYSEIREMFIKARQTLELSDDVD